MSEEKAATAFDYLKLFLENTSLWPLIAIGVIIWIMRKPAILQNFSKIVLPGGIEITLRELEEKIEQQKQRIEKQGEDIKVLETDLVLERHNLQTLIESFDANAPLSELDEIRPKIKSLAGQVESNDDLAKLLTKGASPEQLYTAAVILRESRPIELFGPLVDCLERLAQSPTLEGIRLNTVWTLTSALHRMLIASIRDKIGPPLTEEVLRRTQAVLGLLERNSRVQFDNPLNPNRGVRGPIKNALNWVEKGLNAPS